jgi:hypothetical protein
MALDQSALLEVLEALKAAEVDDRIRKAAETIYQALIEAELSAVIDVAPHQRTEARTGWRNGHRLRTVTSTAGMRTRRQARGMRLMVISSFGLGPMSGFGGAGGLVGLGPAAASAWCLMR